MQAEHFLIKFDFSRPPQQVAHLLLLLCPISFMHLGQDVQPGDILPAPICTDGEFIKSIK